MWLGMTFFEWSFILYLLIVTGIGIVCSIRGL